MEKKKSKKENEDNDQLKKVKILLVAGPRKIEIWWSEGWDRIWSEFRNWITFTVWKKRKGKIEHEILGGREI